MKLNLSLVTFITALLFSTGLFAQNNPVPLKTIPVKHKGKGGVVVLKDTIAADSIAIDNGKEDISDFIARIRHRKPSRAVDSITSKPEISIAPAIGYTLLSKFALVLSGNAILKTGPNSRISTIIASVSYTQNKQFILPVQTNIWSKDNNYNFVGAYQYYKYPQSTYGLGSSCSIKNVDPMDYSYFMFYQTVLRHITGDLYAGVGFIFDTHWNISDKGNSNGTVSDYSLYGKESHTVASGLTFNMQLDSRDNGINPLKGAYASLQYRDNYEFLGSSDPWRSLIIDVRKYIRLPAGTDNVLALWSYNWFVLSGKPGYLDLPSTQWDTNSATGRGYIQGRFRGAQMVYFESEYRFKITRNGLLGGVLFINGESFSAAPGTGLQRIQPGYGPGVRLKLNKTSNTNITIDYGFGSQGSNGLFIDVGEAF
ncbi:outer membrane protein assembly factor [Mucilaginibacter sp. BJC16-A38]|uniref:outer membrane protein assembly factor n=1 Tax=Mucilaginibacter phenanthrenivorans TaxID=1234842 RepID=UPI0021588F3B|nr:outer membrane protein assembly factor [Mucilaginibacter phenanthrenivorans]MCR8559782.1 outer membrane protein assembly factor [Mucilaginibacter phenanthrenivorans]